jgi:serine protease Do
LTGVDQATAGRTTIAAVSEETVATQHNAAEGRALLEQFRVAFESATDAEAKLGLSVRPLTPELAGRLGYDDTESGVVVDGIVPGSPADRAALRLGDLIKEVNRESVENVEDLARATAELEDGDAAALLVQRGPNTFYRAIEIAT